MSTTTGTPPETTARLLTRWAAEQLELEPNVSLREARAAFVAKLPDEDFVPPLRWQQAYRVLGADAVGPAVVVQALADEETRLRTEVECFAVEFWQLNGERRRERWQEIFAACAALPTLAARLRALEPGLKIATEAAPSDAAARELIEILRELFILRPLPRAIRRQEFLRELGADRIRQMEKAARELRGTPFAALAPDLIEQLTSWSYRAELRPKVRRQREKAAAAAAAAERARSTSSGNSGRFAWLYIAIAVGLIRVCAGGFNQKSSYNPPSHTPPTFTMQFNVKLWQQSLDDQLAKPEDQAQEPLGEATRRLLGIKVEDFADAETKKKYEELQRRLQKRRLDPTIPPFPKAPATEKRSPLSRP
jgi:hypothetical protein